MKKTISMVLIAIFVISSVIGVTAVISKNNIIKKPPLDTIAENTTSSEHYEVIEFVPPEKTVYSLNDVYTVDLSTNEEEKKFVQQIDFDGTGMSMTVKNNKTGDIKKHDYTCSHFNLEGEYIKTEGCLTFNFNPGINTELTEGKYTTQVVLTLEDGECIFQEMEFTLTDDTTNKPSAQTQTEPITETPQKQQAENKTQLSDTSTDKETNDDKHDTNSDKTNTDEITIPQLKNIWCHARNPRGCTIRILSQDGNSFDMQICSSNEDATKIATADVSVTLKDVYYDGSVVRGNGSFEYTDSFGNTGTGTINVSENVILMVINEGYNAGSLWGISNTTGKYIYS